ncbi:MAG: D-alanyl-D-alanine carboxypeptidase [Clostridia bacterium]|nr:D-alanyl-D-alanine carboxypeptidase [Clostridia bacterium]
MKKILVMVVTVILLTVMLASNIVYAEEILFDIVSVNDIIKQTDINNLKATAAIMIDSKTGKILFQKNINQRLPIASLTKIMSMYLIMEAIGNGTVSYDTLVTASEYAVSFGGSQVYLEKGEQFTLKEMINAIDLHSANDATVAVAELIGGSENAFVQMMNAKAKELGMENTSYVDCTGLTDEGQYSTAKDLAVLSNALVKDYPAIFEFSTKTYEPFRPGDHQIDLYNRNKLIQFYSGADGLKTGFTTLAGECLSATAKRNDFRLVTIVLGEPDTNTRFAETAKLLDYGFLSFGEITLKEKNQIAGIIPVEKGIISEVECYVNADSTFLIRLADEKNIERVVTMKESLVAPVQQDTVIGNVTYMLNGEQLGRVDILTKTSIEKASFFELLWRKILSWFGIKR